MLHKLIRVLIAGESASVRDAIRSAIRPYSDLRYFEFKEAYSAASTLEAVRSSSFDLVFFSLDIPGLKISLILNEGKELSPPASLWIPVASGLARDKEAELSRAGAYHQIKKPVCPSEVGEIIVSYMKMAEELTVLLVDEDTESRAALRTVLEDSLFNFRILEACGGAHALKLIASGKVQIVLTDFKLPDFDGLVLAGNILGLSSKIKIIMMAENESAFLERSAAFIGISGFLQKPFSRQDVEALMHRYLNLPAPRFGKSRGCFAYQEREIERQRKTLFS